jgi:hypothetical protein
MRDMKPLLGRDPARESLASAIAVEVAAKRDLQLAEKADEYANRSCWQAQSALDELQRMPAAPSGVLAARLAASIASGDACNVSVLERPRSDVHARIAAAEKEIMIWRETISECVAAVRDKEAELSVAKERVERCAREIVCNSAMAARLMDDLEAKQAELVERRVVLRFIWGKGLNGELSGPDRDRMARLLRQDLTGMESHPVRGVWQSVFEKLMEDPEVELPSSTAATQPEFAGAA